MHTRASEVLRRPVAFYVIFAVLGLAVGIALAPAVLDVTSGTDGTVAVVHVDGTIDGQQAAEFSAAMAEARSEADAVVIVANSGGGSASASEEMYMQTKRTSDEMPVVASIDGAAASGAYYTIAPADRIYTKPSSAVGSIGVVAPVPPSVEPNELLGTTGPNKLTGSQERQFYHDLETLQRTFVAAIFAQRADRIELTEAELAHASVFLGLTAVEHGLADDVGDREQAIRFAAAEAGIDRPEVEVYTTEDRNASFMLRSTYLASEADHREMTGVDPFVEDRSGPPTFLMVPGSVFADSEATAITPAAAAELANETEMETAANETDTETDANETDAGRSDGVDTIGIETDGRDRTRIGTGARSEADRSAAAVPAERAGTFETSPEVGA